MGSHCGKIRLAKIEENRASPYPRIEIPRNNSIRVATSMKVRSPVSVIFGSLWR
ncbi:hypothetical protein C7S16_7258 [Burkholderia thailandensis]|uniref:Uncharacterized protein n=1 Tax=Burkholderia thailandensis TaxID=57975 RepID=A0AAW9CQX2_BURTH|nr:hypothetical protein [Burkholderia thailandensis]